MDKKRVLLGMSGGVDSSVAALLLKNEGYEVVGTTLDLFCKDEQLNESTINDAKRMCDCLELEHHAYDFKEEFKTKVINDFINCYANCKTPNPCIECNKYMKFGLMLKKSNAGRKDQSYVLWSIPKEILEFVLFPLADFESKDEIRNIAKENNLQTANKPDSEDICFIPDGDYKKFLEENSNIRPKVGNIVNKQGKVLGKHTGLYNYTIGQRKGLGISNPVPLFVLGFNSEKNEVVVGEEKDLYSEEIEVTDINLLLVDEIKSWMEVMVKTRYSAKEAKAKIKQVGKNIKVVFDEPQRAVTPGQSAVFYIDDIVLGGGKII